MFNTFIFILAILILTILVIFSKSSKVKNSSDFLSGNKSFNTFEVASVIVGTLAGGASTVGTVQMAYNYGLAGTIFTLGSAVACFILGLFMAKPLHNENIITVSGFLGKFLGKNFLKFSSFFSTLGIFIHTVAQLIAGGAIISAFFRIELKIGTFFSAVLVLLYAITGGVKGSSVIGKIKIAVIYMVMTISCVIVYQKSGFHFFKNLPPGVEWFSIFSYGYGKGIYDILFMVIGVLSTQVYLQAVFSAKNKQAAQYGAILSGIMILPIGFMGSFIGMFMRTVKDFKGSTASVLPEFINTFLPENLASVFLAFILFIILGTTSGLITGITTNIYKDFIKSTIESVKKLRMVTLGVVSLSYLIMVMDFQSLILKWSYMSMGIRGGAIFIPLVTLMLFRKKVYLKKYNPVFYVIFGVIVSFYIFYPFK